MNMISQTSPLALKPMTYAGPAARWRHEAMRSHDTGRLIHVTKGQGRITLAGLTTGYGPNNLIHIPPNTMYGIEIGPTVFAQIMTLPTDGPTWPDHVFHLRFLDVVVQKELQGLIEAVERELQPNGDMRAALCHLGLLHIFVERHLAKHSAQPDPRRNSAAGRLVARYTKLIAQDFHRDRSIADYAAQLGVTPTHLSRVCRQSCDRSALDLLNERIHFEACALLRDTDMAIQDIAHHLGFASPAYFTRSFQSRAGKTPSDFRRNK